MKGEWRGWLALLAMVLGLCWMVGSVVSGPERFDDVEDPDFVALDGKLSVWRDLAAVGKLVPGTAIDVADIRAVGWVKACLFGGYRNPITDFKQLGFEVSDADMERADHLRSGYRLDEVEETEAMFAFVDSANRAHFVHFQDGIGPDGQGFATCVTRPATQLMYFYRMVGTADLLKPDARP